MMGRWNTCALSAKKFTAQTTTELLTILSRFGCREMPTPSNLKQLLLQLAKYEFVTKPFATICSINQLHKLRLSCSLMLSINASITC